MQRSTVAVGFVIASQAAPKIHFRMIPALVWRSPFLALLIMFSCSAHSSDWYVSPVGSDEWSGKLPEPNAASTDGPFATLEKARDAVRLELAGSKKSGITVHVRAGTFRRSAPFELGEKDSGEAGSPVVWRGYQKERPKVTGALPLKNWIPANVPGKSGVLSTALPDKLDLANCRQLFAGGERLPLARYPNADASDMVTKGWAYAGGQEWPMYADIPGEDKRTLQMRPQDVRTWTNPSDAEVFVFARYNWWNDLVSVVSADANTGVLKLSKDCSYPIRAGNRYFVQGPLEELDAPGEWHLDRRTRVLYLLPRPEMKSDSVELVIASGLLTIKHAKYVSFENFDWEACGGSAVVLAECESVRFAGNVLKNVGHWSGSGVSVSGGRDVVVRSNTVAGAGRNGVLISGGNRQTLEKCDHVVENNHLHDFGVYFKQGVGVAVTTIGAKIARNHIHHGPRFGVMHGGNLNVIELNHLHDLSLETEDTGAIYSGGRDWITPRGSVIRHNWIHDVYGMDLHNGKLTTPHFSWGIYLDDNSGGADVIGNIVERCGRGGIHVHGARDCWILNNIWVGNRQWQVDVHGWSVSDRYTRSLPAMIEGYEKVAAEPAWQKLRGMELHPKDAPMPSGLTMRGNRFERNILVSSDPEVPVIDVRQVPFTHNHFDQNVYWAPGGVVRTGFLGAGATIGTELLGAWKGAPQTMPEGWRWGGKPSESPKGGLSDADKEVVVFRIEGIKKPYPFAYGPSVALEAGAAYRLRARVRASHEAKASIGVQSFVTGEYFWMSPKSEVRVSTDWEDREWVFSVPVQGQAGWHPKMNTFSARVEWRAEDGWLEVAGLGLQRVEMRSEWESWREKGVDQGSLVADPKFEEGDPKRLSKDSPAWLLGFERIPVEKIGLYSDEWRSGLPE